MVSHPWEPTHWWISWQAAEHRDQPVVFFAELGFKVAGYAMWGVPDMNEVNRAVILESNTTNIERARSEKHTEILLNYKNKEGKKRKEAQRRV